MIQSLRLFAAGTFLTLLLLQTGCGGGGSTSTPAPPPAAADFTLTLSPSSLSVQAGSTANLQVNATWTGTPTATISISVSGLPAGVSLSPTGTITIPVGGTSVTVSATAATGLVTTPLTIVATAGTIQHQYILPLTITAPPLPAKRTSYILAGETPESIVYDRAHKVLYASEPSLNQVLIIDAVLHTTLKTLPVPAAGQSSLSPDGSQIVVGSDIVAALTFISTATQSITRVVPFTIAENGINFFGAAMSQSIEYPVFVAGGDVVFIAAEGFNYSDGPLFRWSAATNKIQKCNGQPSNTASSLNRSPDGSKVLVATSQNETDIYDAATDSLTARSAAFTVFAAADPVNPRFAAYDSNGFEIVDTNLKQLAAFPFSTQAAHSPYAAIFSLDGTQLFVAQSGLFGGLYSYQAVDAVHYTMGSQAPLMSFDGDDEVSNDVDSEIPLAIDETSLIYGDGIRGIAIDDPLNYYTTSSPAKGRGFEFFNPNHGPVGVATGISPRSSYAADTTVYFSGPSGSPVLAGVISPNSNAFTTPSIVTPGPSSIEMLEPDNSFSFYPAAYTFGAQAVAVEPAAGPAAGGISADVIAYGAGGGISTVTVTVGGVPATITSVQGVGGTFPSPLPIYDITFTVPPGTAGTRADVVVSASGNSSTLVGAFTYEPQITNYPYPSGSAVPNSIVYDPHRQRVYLIANNQIDVFSMNSRSFLPPIIPPTVHGSMSLTGLDISVDGTMLAIANLADQSIAVVNPDTPSSSPKLFSLALTPFGSGYLGGPYSIAATSKGTFFIGTAIPAISSTGGSLYELNPVSGSLQQRSNVGTVGLNAAGFRLGRSADGSKVAIASPNDSAGPIVLWNSTTDTFASLSTQGFVDDGAISPDGTTIGLPVDDYGYFAQYVLDSSFSTLSTVVTPEGLEGGSLFGQFFNPSGALFYLPVINGIDIYDVHSGVLRKRIGVKEPGNGNVNQAATMNDTGNYLFLMTLNGLDVIEDVPPLSVRSASPLLTAASAGTVITLRGANFQAGATITIAGQTVPATVTDSQTLTFTLPAAVTNLGFTVSNPDASTYTY